jgi:hypothetical protein
MQHATVTCLCTFISVVHGRPTGQPTHREFNVRRFLGNSYRYSTRNVIIVFIFCKSMLQSAQASMLTTSDFQWLRSLASHLSQYSPGSFGSFADVGESASLGRPKTPCQRGRTCLHSFPVHRTCVSAAMAFV